MDTNGQSACYGPCEKAWPVFYAEYNIDTFLKVHPVPAAAGTGGGSRGVVIALVAVAVIVAAGAVLIVTRRRSQAVEES